MLVRLQKIISQAGFASRRKAEELIQSGRVRVNGIMITELGTKANPETDRIEIDGQRIEPQQPRMAILLNKPDGYITSTRDPQGRRTVTQIVDHIPVRLYPVGRLDFHTEGLLILTNDGDLAQAIEHPSKAIAKTYEAKVKGIPSRGEIEKLRKGIYLDGRKTAPAEIRLLETRINAWFRITIKEGRKNQIRRMFEMIGHPVIKLRRVAIGFLTDPKLKPGDYRYLTRAEIQRFLKAAGDGKKTKSGKES